MDRLKTYIFPMLHNSPNKFYLEIWHQIFANNEVITECHNIMDIFEILLIVPFMNAIVEYLFSRINRVKTDFCNRLSRSRLDMCLHVGEEGPSIKDFETDGIMDCWWTEKERRLKSRPHNYPAKKHPRLNSAEYVDLSTLTNGILLLSTFRFSNV